MALVFAGILLCTVANVATAGDCVKSGAACIDSTPCRTISGTQVCLSDFGETCWRYEDTYTCIKPNAVNYCQPIVDSQPQCWQSGSQCIQTDTSFGTGCMRHSQTWRCNDPARPTSSNTIRLDDTYTLISSDYDPGPCQSLADNPSCQIAETKCVSTSPPSLPPGVGATQVAPDGCYQKQNTYACLTGAANTSECDGYASNPNCTLQSTAPCDAEDMIGGQCSYQRQSYRCVSKPPQTSTVTDCAGQQFCQGGNCFDKGYENDPDFARSMALMEAAREAGVYGDTTSIFSGLASSCTVNQAGLSNCCKKSGGGQSNSAVMGVATQVGTQTFKYGSAYAYDALFSTSAPNWVVNGLGSMAGASASYGPGLAASSFSPTLSLYGFTATTGTLGAGVSSLGSFGGVTFGFDPWSLAISVAIMVIQDMLKCEPEEQILSMRLGQNLCHEVGDYCSNKFLGKCITKTRAHCCYNSRLARIINVQGRAQIGKSWGDAKSPNCSGFTTDEFASIDFSRIDMSEFVSEIMASVKMPNTSGISQDVQGSVESKMLNYYQRGSQ
ncbi:MAG: conjugal transfer protein TraN [Pseudomonadota bacterium]|nr:conjugal transfer protein TraN [Pseudomonadota bacterium]MDP1904928.1 conjugal transfer protein TraN [Pseudomonadota bacterium]MDP2352051.1 conjugal transfer protein TraN [Pseudomonadota bacterium]